MDALRRIVTALHRSSLRARDRTRLTGAQTLVLRHVGARPGLSLGELAGLTFTQPSTVSEVVARLEAEGYLTRRRSAEDGRRIELDLTRRGAGAVPDLEMTAQERLMAALRALPAPVRQSLAAGLQVWVAEAALDDTPPVMFFEPEARPDPGKDAE